MAALEGMLERAGVDPWRRWALVKAAADPAHVQLSYGEAWRLGGAPGLLSPHPAIDGGAHFGAAPRSLLLMEGRRSAGMIGASLIDAQLRVATFLELRQLPARLFGDVAAAYRRLIRDFDKIDDAPPRTHARPTTNANTPLSPTALGQASDQPR
jgi:hypothetical protein